MAENIPPTENPSNLERQDQEQYEIDDAAAEGLYEICKALADLLRNQKIVDATAEWLNSRTARETLARNPTPYYVSLVFGLLIFAGIAALAWHKILEPQSTVVLIGALIAAWYGGQRQQPQK